MLKPTEVLRQIEDGTVALAFRRWRRPTVKTGGTLLTSIGRLQIESVTAVSEREITEVEARKAGYGSRVELLGALRQYDGGDVYRIEFGKLDVDPREALRETLPDEVESASILAKLERMDSLAPGGAWTVSALDLISRQPGVRAQELADEIGVEKSIFKANVRKLKALGLTISLGTGYRLSPRGESVLTAVREKAGRLPDER